ncbi:hypothetical protein [Alicyclobacillus vulcanalis]|uniref:Uncharacterized protein n=1 Tax=Alicyclobacillus vulcanalis TaxID=252246 RepID=A0A1N7MR89_9BACL|nr:hypothetical protein [Alicyclobacillus vulcanalis]SIS88580.1 hypothetical protein SAMN05421799_10646 [Alicyclobacillus vulcanalis]
MYYSLDAVKIQDGKFCLGNDVEYPLDEIVILKHPTPSAYYHVVPTGLVAHDWLYEVRSRYGRLANPVYITVSSDEFDRFDREIRPFVRCVEP